ncbi:hypothetical protein [Mycobacteroides chelonae]|uniref:hypothetical protein n=1 Tax=Mycobacteroides chelonae TaxID=1774 RepID=UPI00320513CE
MDAFIVDVEPGEDGLVEQTADQGAFADHVGVHRTYMGSVERGERKPIPAIA